MRGALAGTDFSVVLAWCLSRNELAAFSASFCDMGAAITVALINSEANNKNFLMSF